MEQNIEREKDIEAYLKKRLEAMGCLFLKWVSPGNDGVPDRILIIPGGRICFVEVKTRTGHMTGLQIAWQKKLKQKCCNTICIHGRDEADELIGIVDCIVNRTGARPQ